MRHALLALALVGLVSCGHEETQLVSLDQVNDSGVSGTATIEETAGHSGFGEIRFRFTATDPSSRKLVGFIHEGRCASLGRTENTTGFESDSYSQQINSTREGTPIHAGQLSSYQGDHAFAVHAPGANLDDDSGAVLACGDI